MELQKLIDLESAMDMFGGEKKLRRNNLNGKIGNSFAVFPDIYKLDSGSFLPFGIQLFQNRGHPLAGNASVRTEINNRRNAIFRDSFQRNRC